jgi:uncharacterized protein (DUF1501 family)
MNRRQLMKWSAGAAWVAAAPRVLAAEGQPKRLVVILLRGAVDGLSIVVPYQEAAYYEARPTIAIARPGNAEGGLALDGDFALNPALGTLLPLWTQRQLAFIHAAGSPDPSRSHFDAQRYIETGTPGQDLTPDGWMNRLLAALPGAHGPTAAIGIGSTMPRILAGRVAVANLPRGPDPTRKLPIDRPEIGDAFDRLYAGDDAVGQAYREGRQARTRLIADLASEQRAADNGAPPAAGIPAAAARIAQLLAGDPGIRLVFADFGGWDTHVDQKGQLALRLRALGGGLASLARGLGRTWDDTVVVVLSEFGRTVHENGNAGTDHGHGNVIWVAGGNVAGGKVYGEWPGLTPAQLYQRRDLAVTTDFRCALAAILERHLRLDDPQLDAIFPTLPPISTELRKLIAG